MSTGSTTPALVHHPLIDRFAIECDGQRVAFLSYTLERRKTMTIDVVTVPADRPQTYVEVLLGAAVAWARDHGYTVLGFCPVAQEFLRREREPAPAAAA